MQLKKYFDGLNDSTVTDKSARSLQENVDYAILNETAFSFLYSIYGGTDIRRQTIEVREKIEKIIDINLNSL